MLCFLLPGSQVLLGIPPFLVHLGAAPIYPGDLRVLIQEPYNISHRCFVRLLTEVLEYFLEHLVVLRVVRVLQKNNRPGSMLPLDMPLL